MRVKEIEFKRKNNGRKNREIRLGNFFLTFFWTLKSLITLYYCYKVEEEKKNRIN